VTLSGHPASRKDTFFEQGRYLLYSPNAESAGTFAAAQEKHFFSSLKLVLAIGIARQRDGASFPDDDPAKDPFAAFC
jgi:hypothetical protein